MDGVITGAVIGGVALVLSTSVPQLLQNRKLIAGQQTTHDKVDAVQGETRQINRAVNNVDIGNPSLSDRVDSLLVQFGHLGTRIDDVQEVVRDLTEAVEVQADIQMRNNKRIDRIVTTNKLDDPPQPDDGTTTTAAPS